MNDFAPFLLDCHVAQIDHPDVSQASSYHELSQSVWVAEMAFVQVEPTTFLVREQSLDAKSQ
jgi:hypothetical protein